MKIGIIWKSLETFLEFPGRQREIMFVEGQLAAGQVNIPQFRFCFAGIFEDGVQNSLGIKAAQQQRPAKYYQAGGIIAIHPWPRRTALDDFIDYLVGGIRFAIALENLAGLPAQAQAPWILSQHIGNRAAGLTIFSGGQQGLCEQPLRIFIIGSRGHNLFSLSDALTVIT